MLIHELSRVAQQDRERAIRDALWRRHAVPSVTGWLGRFLAAVGPRRSPRSGRPRPARPGAAAS
jgi:hypothetical protein